MSVMRKGPPRRFDHDLAKVMRNEGGLTYAEIAREMGVTEQAVRFACDPVARQRMREINAAWQRTGTCVDCGTQISRNATRPVERCRECWAIKSSINQTTSAREDTLRCCKCEQWLPDESFGYGKTIGRRLRRSDCRPCETIARREHRQRKAAS